jgi:hypothetical protein
VTKAALGTFAVGALVLLVAEATILHVLGFLILLAAIACGVFAIADPDDLRGEEDQSAR